MEDYFTTKTYSMKNWTITAPEGAVYLSDFLTEIPANSLFNKKQTGCGATELAIRNNVPTIIAMPYVALVKNKSIYRRDDISVLGVYEGVTDEQIISYVQSHSPMKIAVTYDSLPRLLSAIENIGINPFKEVFLLVDEYHILFNAYLLRRKAITNLLTIAQRFDRVTFMTATPIEREYLFDEIKHLPICEIEWPNVVEINVRSRQTSNTDKYIERECKRVITKELPFNLHIFVNSVEFIAGIINNLQLTAEQVKIVCSLNGSSNRHKLGDKYSIEQPSDPIKKINFYTSTCFEGCDIYDENGVTLIVSDGSRSHTLLDISTLFTQICGRLRNSKYKHEIIHVYSTTKYSKDVSLEEYIESTNKALTEAEQYAKDINAIPERSRIKMLSKISYINEPYVRVENNLLLVDRNLANLDIVNFKICRHIYRSYANLSKEMESNGYTITRHTYSKVAEQIQSSPKARIAFKDLFEEYCKQKSSRTIYSLIGFDDICTRIAEKNPLVKIAYERLGENKVRELNYHVGNIRRALISDEPTAIQYKVVRLINEELAHQVAIPKIKIKECLQRIYDDLGIKRKAKATDLARWYDIKESYPKINGKTVASIVIIRDKMIVK